MGITLINRTSLHISILHSAPRTFVSKKINVTVYKQSDTDTVPPKTTAIFIGENSEYFM
jgi:hypothetical protein